MKQKLLLFSYLFCVVIISHAQVPQSIPYQAVARDNGSNLIVNQNIALRFSLRDGSAVGTIVYQETQMVITNSLGLFTTNIGQGAVLSGVFANINWEIIEGNFTKNAK